MKDLLIGLFSCALVIAGTNGCESSRAQTPSHPFPDDIIELEFTRFSLIGKLEDGRLLLTGNTPATGEELWTYDAFSNSLELVVDLNPGRESGAFTLDLPRVNGGFYFAGTTPETGRELWFTDGTPEGTVIIRDASAGPLLSSVRGWEVSPGELVFRIGIHEDFTTPVRTEMLFISE